MTESVSCAKIESDWIEFTIPSPKRIKHPNVIYFCAHVVVWVGACVFEEKSISTIKCNDIFKLNVKNQIYNLKDLMKQNNIKACHLYASYFCIMRFTAFSSSPFCQISLAAFNIYRWYKRHISFLPMYTFCVVKKRLFLRLTLTRSLFIFLSFYVTFSFSLSPSLTFSSPLPLLPLSLSNFRCQANGSNHHLIFFLLLPSHLEYWRQCHWMWRSHLQVVRSLECYKRIRFR